MDILTASRRLPGGYKVQPSGGDRVQESLPLPWRPRFRFHTSLGNGTGKAHREGQTTHSRRAAPGVRRHRGWQSSQACGRGSADSDTAGHLFRLNPATSIAVEPVGLWTGLAPVSPCQTGVALLTSAQACTGVRLQRWPATCRSRWPGHVGICGGSYRDFQGPGCFRNGRWQLPVRRWQQAAWVARPTDCST